MPWYFPTPEAYRELLEKQGFAVGSIELIPRPTKLPGEIVAWLETFADSFTRRVAESERLTFLNEVAAALRPHLRDDGGGWTVDYVRLRFAATKPG